MMDSVSGEKILSCIINSVFVKRMTVLVLLKRFIFNRILTISLCFDT